MKKLICTVTFLSSLLLCAAQSYIPEKKNAKVKVQAVVPVKAFSFPLSDVKLLQSPFAKAMQLDSAYLAALAKVVFRIAAAASKVESTASPLTKMLVKVEPRVSYQLEPPVLSSNHALN